MAVVQQARASLNQTSFLFGAVVFAFLFYVTVKGDLGKWLGLLGLANVQGTSGGSSTAPTATTSPGAPAAAPNPPAFTGLPALPGLGAGAGGMT